MAFEIKYSDEAKQNLDAITTWLLYERRAGQTALRWLQGLQEKIDTLSELSERCQLARESKSLPFELRQALRPARGHGLPRRIRKGWDLTPVFPGFPGVITGAGIMLALWLLVHLSTQKLPKGNGFDFDARNEKGAFEKLLPLYLDIAKFVLGLATGSIVLLVGSSALHTTGHLPTSYASPLFLLCISVGCGILCMLMLITDYEAYRHDPTSNSYTRPKYARNQLLGYSGVFCFLAGYVWLIVIVTA